MNYPSDGDGGGVGEKHLLCLPQFNMPSECLFSIVI